MRGEIIDQQEWEAYSWIQNNVEEEEIILFFGSVTQAESVYTKRIHADFQMDEYQNLLNQLIETNETPTRMKVSWGASTPRTNYRQLSFWKFEKWEDPDMNVSINDFDYIYFKDMHENMVQINNFFISEYITNHGFSLVYNSNKIKIIKNEKNEHNTII